MEINPQQKLTQSVDSLELQKALDRSVEVVAELVAVKGQELASAYAKLDDDLNNVLDRLSEWEAGDHAVEDQLDYFQDQQQETLQLGQQLAQTAIEAMQESVDFVRAQQSEEASLLNERVVAQGLDPTLAAQQREMATRQAQERDAVWQAVTACAQMVDDQRADLEWRMKEQRDAIRNALFQEDPAKQQQAFGQIRTEEARRTEIVEKAKDLLATLSDADKRLDWEAMQAAFFQGQTEKINTEYRAKDAQWLTQTAEAIIKEMLQQLQRTEEEKVDRAFSEDGQYDVGRLRVYSLEDIQLENDQQQKAAGALLGQEWDNRLCSIWQEVTTAASTKMMKVEDLLGANQFTEARHLARSSYDKCRDDFWNTIRKEDNYDVYKRFRDSGLIFGDKGPPYYETADGKKAIVTIDHYKDRLADNPIRAIDPSNLRFSLNRENTVVLEAYRRDERRMTGEKT